MSTVSQTSDRPSGADARRTAAGILTPNTKSYDRGPGGIVLGLVAATGVLAFVVLVTLGTLGILLATGTLRHTSQGWAFQPPPGSRAAGELRTEKLDPKVDTIFLAQGSGSSETSTFTASRAWRADWTYSCASSSGRFHVVAQSGSRSYPAGSLDGPIGAGNSNRIPAGTYTFEVTTDLGCSWAVGARPDH